MAIRVSAIQYHLHTISSFEEFAAQCEPEAWTSMVEGLKSRDTVSLLPL